MTCPHLMAALPTLTRTLRYGDVRGTDVSALVDVADSLLIRICTGLAVAVTGLDDPSAEELRDHLDKVHSAIMVRDDRDASARWLQTMAGVIDRDDVNGLLVGRMVRLLRDSGSITETAAAQRLSRALSVGKHADRQSRVGRRVSRWRRACARSRSSVAHADRHVGSPTS